jgi:20S proteasome subunit beta 2
LVLGGVDPVLGPQLYTIHPHGSVDKLPFVAMGSGSLAAMSVLESKWKPGMNREEAIELVQAAIESGIYNDLGSGSNVDLCVIKSDYQVDYLRNHHCPPHRTPLANGYKPPRGSTIVLEESVTLFN